MNNYPVELLDRILDFSVPLKRNEWPKSEHYAQLARTALISRGFIAISRSKLYSKLSSRVTSKSALHTSIAGNPALANFVRQVEFDWPRVDFEDWSTRRKAEWVQREVQGVVEVWKSCDNLATFRILAGNHLNMSWKDLRGQLGDIWSRQPQMMRIGLKAVTKVEIYSPDACLSCLVECLSILDVLPDVKSLSLNFGDCIFWDFMTITDLKIAAKQNALHLGEAITDGTAVELATLSPADELVYTLHVHYQLLPDYVYCDWDEWSSTGDEVDGLLNLDKTGCLVYRLCATGSGNVCRKLLVLMPDLYELDIGGYALQEEEDSFFKALSRYKSAQSLRSLGISSYCWTQNEDWSLLSISPPIFPRLVDVRCQSSYDEQEENSIAFEMCLSKTRLLQISSERPALNITFEFYFYEMYDSSFLEATAKDGLLSNAAVIRAEDRFTTMEKMDVEIQKMKERIGWW